MKAMKQRAVEYWSGKKGIHTTHYCVMTKTHVDIPPKHHATFLIRTGARVVEEDGTDKGNDHGIRKDGVQDLGTVAATKHGRRLAGQPATRTGHRHSVEDGKSNNELVARRVHVHVL